MTNMLWLTNIGLEPSRLPYYVAKINPNNTFVQPQLTPNIVLWKATSRKWESRVGGLLIVNWGLWANMSRVAIWWGVKDSHIFFAWLNGDIIIKSHTQSSEGWWSLNVIALRPPSQSCWISQPMLLGACMRCDNLLVFPGLDEEESCSKLLHTNVCNVDAKSRDGA